MTLICSVLMMTSAADSPIEVESAPVACDSFIGFGAEWDPPGYVSLGVTDDEFKVVDDRVRWMRLPLARVMMQTKWCYFESPSAQGDELAADAFDWETPEMKALYRQLAVCQQLGTAVFLTDRGGEKEWTTAPGIHGVDDPKYARVIGVYLDHLIRTKGFTCIKYLIVTNEPNWEVGDWDKWKRGVLQVAAEVKRRGLDTQVTMVGSDTSQGADNEPWHRLAVDQLNKTFGVYDIHRYAEQNRVRAGALEDYWREQWAYVRQNDPNGAQKPCIVGEAGMNDNADHPRGSAHINEYGYGVFMADYAVQAARAGTAAVSAWMLDDNAIEGFYWGLWDNKKNGMTLRPWFYTWSLLSRYVPAGATIYAPDQPSDLRVLAAKSAADWTICLVNRRDETATLRLRLPGQTPFKQYRYENAIRSVDDQGYPQPVSTHTPGILELLMPPDSVLVLTSLR